MVHNVFLLFVFMMSMFLISIICRSPFFLKSIKRLIRVLNIINLHVSGCGISNFLKRNIEPVSKLNLEGFMVHIKALRFLAIDLAKHSSGFLIATVFWVPYESHSNYCVFLLPSNFYFKC